MLTSQHRHFHVGCTFACLDTSFFSCGLWLTPNPSREGNVECKNFTGKNYVVANPICNITFNAQVRGISIVQGVTEDRLSGETRRVGVLLADNDAGRKKGAAISVDEVSPWLRSCKICRRRAFPSSLVSLNAQHF